MHSSAMSHYLILSKGEHFWMAFVYCGAKDTEQECFFMSIYFVVYISVTIVLFCFYETKKNNPLLVSSRKEK